MFQGVACGACRYGVEGPCVIGRNSPCWMSLWHFLWVKVINLGQGVGDFDVSKRGEPGVQGPALVAAEVTVQVDPYGGRGVPGGTRTRDGKGMSNPVHLYVWQAAIVGNARLGGQDLRALMLDDPDVASNYPSRDVLRGFAWDEKFEPSFSVWLEHQRQRGLKAVRALYAVDPADWVLTTPPPPQPRLPELALVFQDSVVWYRHVYSPLRPESPMGPSTSASSRCWRSPVRRRWCPWRWRSGSRSRPPFAAADAFNAALNAR